MRKYELYVDLIQASETTDQKASSFAFATTSVLMPSAEVPYDVISELFDHFKGNDKGIVILNELFSDYKP